MTAGQGCPAPRKGAAVPTYDAELVATLDDASPEFDASPALHEE